MLQRLVLGDTFAGGFTVGIRIIATELFEWLTFRTDVLVVVRVPFKVGARPCAVCPACFVQHRNVGFDIAIYEPSFILLVFQQDKRNYATQFRMCPMVWRVADNVYFVVIENFSLTPWVYHTNTSSVEWQDVPCCYGVPLANRNCCYHSISIANLKT